MIKIKDLQDVCTTLDPDSDVKTYTYEFEGLPHGSRLDMGLTWGLTPTKYEHFNTRMSDHKSILFSVDANDKDRELKAPETKKPDKMRPDIAKDKIFKDEAKRLVTAAAPGRQGTNIIDWWLDNVKELVLKAGMARQKAVGKEQRKELDELMAEYNRWIATWEGGDMKAEHTISRIKDKIGDWYKRRSKQRLQEDIDIEIAGEAGACLADHEMLKKASDQSMIQELHQEAGPTIKGHEAVQAHLEASVEKLLNEAEPLCPRAQESLLKLIPKTVDAELNSKLLKKPTKGEMYRILKKANFRGAPGLDGIPACVYKECWSFLGDYILELAEAVFEEIELPQIMKTSIMVFLRKPGKPPPLTEAKIRKISLLNCDLKLITGLITDRLNLLATDHLSKNQYV